MVNKKNKEKHSKQMLSAVLVGTLLMGNGGVQTVMATEAGKNPTDVETGTDGGKVPESKTAEENVQEVEQVQETAPKVEEPQNTEETAEKTAEETAEEVESDQKSVVDPEAEEKRTEENVKVALDHSGDTENEKYDSLAELETTASRGTTQEVAKEDAGDLTADCFKDAKNNNPIATQRYSADPGVMVYNDTVYVYATNDIYEYDENGQVKTNSYGKIRTINCFSSKDMVNWTDHGAIPVAGKNDETGSGAAKWANNSWAPCAAHKTINGKEKFFLYFADNGSGIGVLTSDSPTGPWVDPLGKQLISRQTPTCDSVEWLFDPAVFVDDDGTGYLYFGGGVPKGKEADPGTARVVKLGSDMISTDGDPVQINPPYLFEDSGINKIGDKYYYSYCSNWNTSGSGYNTAAIEYMVSDNPMGPFKYEGELFQNPGNYFGVWGNNHHSMFELNGQLYLAYHARALETAALGKDLGYRTTQIDKVEFDQNTGKISLTDPTLTGVEQLQTLDPYTQTSATTMARQCGIEVNGSGDPALTVTANDWTGLKGVEFNKGLADISVQVKADAAMNIEVHTGSSSGKLLGTIKVDPTNGEYKTFTGKMKNLTGKKNLFFVYTGAAEVKNWKASPYTFDRLEKTNSYGLKEKVQEDGSMTVDYDSQWAEIRFAIPEGVDTAELSKIVINGNNKDVSNLAVKALETDGSDGTDAIELNAAYGTTELDLADVDKSKLKYFGIMYKGESAASFSFDSVVFETGNTKAEEESDAKGIQRNVPDLKEKVQAKTDKDFLVGAEITLGEINDDNLMALVEKHFNAVTLGNELKPDANFNYSNDKCPGTQKAELNGEQIEVPVTDFSRAEKMLDKIYDFNKEHPKSQIKIRGHVLTWHSQTPEWFFHEDYDASKPYVDKDTMSKRHEWYIKTVLEHFVGKDSKYKDMFYGWDVVNEAVSDSTGTYRTEKEKSSWWAVYNSPEFIINAFRFANKYAPKDLELYYNDYNEWVDSKVKGISQLLTDVKNAEGTRIDGMGMQGHYAVAGSPSVEDFKKAATAYGKIVDKVQLTELDFKASSAYDGTDATYAAEDTRLAYRYKDIYQAVQELRQEGIHFSNMTIWGVIDKNSWLQTSNSVGGAADGKTKQMPLLFDDNYQVKSAYWALVDDTKLEPEIKSFDILQSKDGTFEDGYKLNFGNGTADAEVIPVWNEKKLKVKVKVKDTKKDDKDAFTVYFTEGNEIKTATLKRADAKETADGYEGIVTVPVAEKDLFVTSKLAMDFAITNGAERISYNDYTNSQEKKADFYANAMLKPYMSITKGSAVIDGEAGEEWDNIEEVPLTIALGTNVKASAKLMWDEKKLYVYAKVKDDVLNAESLAAHEQDSIEVFVDENNHKTKKYEEDDKQYRINYLNGQSFNGKKCNAENLESVAKTVDDGYVVEMAMNWTDITPKAGDKVGLELQINDANAEAKRSGTLSWYDASGAGWENPSVFGTVTLADQGENGGSAQLTAAKEALQKAEAQLTKAKKDLEKKEAEQKTAEKELAAANTRAEAAEKVSKKAQDVWKAAQKELKAAEKKQKEAKAAYNRAQKEYKEFEDIAKDLKKQAEKLEKKEKKATGSAKIAIKTAMKQIKSSASKTRKVAEKYKRDADKEEKKLDAGKKEVNKAQKKVKDAEKKAEKASKESKKEQKAVKAEKAKVEAARSAKEAAKKKMEKAEKAVAKAKAEVEKLQP